MKLSEILSVFAIIISIGSASFSYMQMKTARNQNTLSNLQIRPYVKYMPIFSIEKSNRLTIDMYSENMSPIPARVIFDQLSTWVNGETTGVVASHSVV